MTSSMGKPPDGPGRKAPVPSGSLGALDKGTIHGPEVWRVVEGVEFAHWDRWLLRLALAEPHGLDSIEATFRERRSNRRSHDDAVAMLSQLADLRRRLSQLGRSAGDVLDAEEIASEGLFNKAWKRVWHSGPHWKTRAMVETPRWRLERRALRGRWSEFPVSPAVYERELRNMVGGERAYLDYRVVGAIAGALETHVRFLSIKASKEERLALHRCAMTVVIETMDRADDSGADLAVAFEAFESAYLDLAVDFLDRPVVIEDLLDLATWEGYGLVRRVEKFLATLPERHADAAMKHLARVIAELRKEELEWHLDRATRFRSAVLGSITALPNATGEDSG